jgi:hypothetical protein
VETVNVIVTCTKDKRQPVATDCQLRTVPRGSMSDRFNTWRERLARRRAERVAVRDLYAGDHWSTVRSFASSHFAIDVWVCSAGYGLVRMEDLVVPYAATFSGNHPDSVTRNVADLDSTTSSEEWWGHASRWKSDFRNRPRSIASLMSEYPHRSLLVVASETYLRAIANDLREGAKAFPDPDRLSILSAGVKQLSGLDEYLVPCDARLQPLVGGALRSLNTRLARRVLGECRHPPRRSSLSRRYQSLLDKQPTLTKYDRKPMTDANVRKFISEQLASNPNLSHTPLLRRLREQDCACEQKRFAQLYRDVRSQNDDN